MKTVSEKLKQGFGFDLILQNNAYYLIVAYKQCDTNLRMQMLNNGDVNDKKWRGLVSVILQFIILNGGKCSATTLQQQFFDKINTSEFGSPKQIIQMLKQQKWIHETAKNDNGHQHFSLGARASIETRPSWQYKAAHQLVTGQDPSQEDIVLVTNQCKQ